MKKVELEKRMKELEEEIHVLNRTVERVTKQRDESKEIANNEFKTAERWKDECAKKNNLAESLSEDLNKQTLKIIEFEKIIQNLKNTNSQLRQQNENLLNKEDRIRKKLMNSYRFIHDITGGESDGNII